MQHKETYFFHSMLTEKQTNNPSFQEKINGGFWRKYTKQHLLNNVFWSPHKRRQITIVGIWPSHKKYQHCGRDNKNLFVEIKRTKGGRETGMRHSKEPQTQHWTQGRDWTLGDPNSDTGTVCKAMLAELLTCFSRSFGLQLTTDLFTPTSLNIAVIWQKISLSE